MAASSDKELLFTIEFNRDDLPKFQVIRFEGHEEVSRLFRFDIILAADTADVDLDAALNANATLRIWTRDHSTSSPYHGMVAEFEQQGQVDDYYFYRLALVPRLWRLGLSRLTDVYLDEQSIPELVMAILQRNGLRPPDVKKDLKEETRNYRQRSFICQYQESDLDFISRWMEQEGIYYFFDHEDEAATGEVLRILDFKEAQPAKAVTLRYTPPENVQTDRQDTCATAFTCAQTHVPGKVLVQDFNFRKASMGDNLRTEHDVGGGQKGRYMYYGDNLRTEQDTTRLAAVRAQQLACRAKVFQGGAPAVGVRSGGFLDLTHHYRDSYNSRYWVTSVRHSGSQAGVVLAGRNTGRNETEQGSLYECHFTALAADQQFRSEHHTPKPVVSGVLNAIIDSEGDGNQAELNEYGQYKVQLMYDYPDDSREKDSSWLRMMTPYAGSRQGMHFPLLKGTEVLIGFIAGDPDQPFIMGAIPNSENPNVVREVNAYCNGILTTQGNVLNMVDKPGQEVVNLRSPVMNSSIFIGTFPSVGDDVTLSSPNASDSDPAEILNNLV